MAQIDSVIKRNGARVPFNPDRITNAIYRAAVAVGGRDRGRAAALSAEVVALLEEQHTGEDPPHIEEIQDMVEKVLIENGHATVAKAYILYRNERAQKRQSQSQLGIKDSANVPWEKIWYVLNWATDHGVNTITGLNERLQRGDLHNIIIESEAAYATDLENAANRILEHKDQIRIVIVCGPSSSGKTTTTVKLEQRLSRHGMRFVALNVDHYFFNLSMHPKDEFGDYDFETPQALDMALINQHLEQLVAGQEVQIPFYDFKTGKRAEKTTPLQLHKGDVLLIDSLHGLYPPMTESVPDEEKFRVYLEPLLQLKDENGDYVRWTDIRLMRRMLRDAAFRAYDPKKTLTHWHYVRSSELRHIIPNNRSADIIINSAMPYELALYAHKLGASFNEWAQEFAGDPLRQDAFTRAQRVNRLLQKIHPIAEDAAVPGDSVIREFIGGSTLNVH
jgi:uridine kinase